MSYEEPNLDPASLLDGLDFEIPAATPNQQVASAEVPLFFGPYQLIQQVGEGGVARVLRARHIHPSYADTTFAVKIMHRQLSKDPQVVDLFRHEAYVLSLIKHPNIVQTFEAGSLEDELFIAMEYIEGRDLENMLERSRHTRSLLPLAVSMHIIGEVLKALIYAHELADPDGKQLNLIHRDVTPANVFLSFSGHVKLGDFGVASIAAGLHEKERELVGKPGYFAPEQASGNAIDQRADIFSLGVVMYEMLTATRLFSGNTTEEIMKANRKAKIPRPRSLNPNLPPQLEEVLLTALARKPEDRYSNAREMAQALNGFVPPPTGMSLAVAAMMRKLFLSEHIQELQLREGLSGSTIANGAAKTIAICTGDERAQAAFSELLLSRGFHPVVCSTHEKLVEVLARPINFSLILVDVCNRNFNPVNIVNILSHYKCTAPVIAVSDALCAQWVHNADVIGAVDLIYKPFNIERVLSAIRAAIVGASTIANRQKATSTDTQGLLPHILVVSKTPQFAVQLAKEITHLGFEVDVSPSAAEALERTNYASYRGVIYDAFPAEPSDRNFIKDFRSCPAMGMIPMIILAQTEARQIFAGINNERAILCRRDETSIVLANHMRNLLLDNRLGRVFLRYAVSIPVELRSGGRNFNCMSVDISRGGIKLYSHHISPVGTQVGVAFSLPSLNKRIEVRGKVMRVEIQNDSNDRNARIGIEFGHFAGRSEAILISFLISLVEQSNLAKLTTTLDVSI
ncbi:MAG: protein kinase [Deltaproteobacteria bacterium]|nr:protein kinase [Deltaproteobacteria bacterium]